MNERFRDRIIFEFGQFVGELCFKQDFHTSEVLEVIKNYCNEDSK